MKNIIVQDLQYRYDYQKDFFILVSFIDFKFKLVFFLEDDLLKEEVYLNVIVKLSMKIKQEFEEIIFLKLLFVYMLELIDINIVFSIEDFDINNNKSFQKKKLSKEIMKIQFYCFLMCMLFYIYL